MITHIFIYTHKVEENGNKVFHFTLKSNDSIRPCFLLGSLSQVSFTACSGTLLPEREPQTLSMFLSPVRSLKKAAVFTINMKSRHKQLASFPPWLASVWDHTRNTPNILSLHLFVPCFCFETDLFSVCSPRVLYYACSLPLKSHHWRWPPLGAWMSEVLVIKTEKWWAFKCWTQSNCH